MPDGYPATKKRVSLLCEHMIPQPRHLTLGVFRHSLSKVEQQPNLARWYLIVRPCQS
jgi:hypothetical protein